MLKKLPALDVEGPPLTDPQQWQLRVGGLVERPRTYGIAEIRALPSVEAELPLICVEGWDLWVKWKGVRLRDIIAAAGPRPEARWLTFYAYSEYTDSLSLADARDERTLLAYGLEGGDLPAENGGPLRLVVPFKLGYKSVKWVQRIEFAADEELGYWEVRGYPPEAGVPDDKREEYGI